MMWASCWGRFSTADSVERLAVSAHRAQTLAKWFALFILALIVFGGRARACPFCAAPAQTFSEEIQAMDLVLFATLVELPADREAEDSTGDLPRCKFKITELIRGDSWHDVGDTIETHYFGSEQPGKTFLIMGTNPPETMWGTPLVVDERVQTYLRSLSGLPEGHERLTFFIKHLEDEDELLARDAYDEFAKTPYEGVVALKDSMDRDTLLAWIQDPDVPPSRRRLYLTMLGICGSEQDCAILEQMLQSNDAEAKAGFDALIACYLSLKGAEGLPLIEERFLANSAADYAETYSAIIAIRFHGNDADVIPRDKLLPGLRAVLKRSELADLVIPDLARWQDWEVMPELIELFKNSDAETGWVRVPVINYLRACPLAEAATAIEELNKIDPESVERANSFFPFTQFADKNPSGTSPDAPQASATPDTTAVESEALAARKQLVPRDRTIYEPQLDQQPTYRWWIPASIFGGLLVVAMLIKLTQRHT